MLIAGAIAASQGQSGSGNNSISKTQGTPSGIRNTPDNGSRSAPNNPKVPATNKASADTQSARSNPMEILQNQFKANRSIYSENHVVLGVSGPVVKDLDNVVTRLPKLSAILYVRCGEVQQGGAVWIVDHVTEAAVLWCDAHI